MDGDRASISLESTVCSGGAKFIADGKVRFVTNDWESLEDVCIVGAVLTVEKPLWADRYEITGVEQSRIANIRVLEVKKRSLETGELEAA